MADIRVIRIAVDSGSANTDLRQLQVQIQSTGGSYRILSDTIRQSNSTAVSEADKFLAALKRQADQAGKTRSEIAAMQSAQLNLTGAQRQAADQMISQLRTQEEAMHSFGLSTTASRRELMVLGHEASQGNWTRFGGSLMVLGEQMDIMGKLLSPVGMGIGALAGGIALFSYEAYQGYKNYKQFSDALSESGNFVGKTSDQLSTMRYNVAGMTGDFAGADQAVAAFAQSGKVAGDQLELFSRTALLMSKNLHIGIDDAQKELLKFTDNVGQAAEEYQKAHHNMNADTVNLIYQLEKEGKTYDAIRVAIEAVEKQHTKMYQKNKEEQGFIGSYIDDWERGLARIKKWMMDIGRPDTDSEKITNLFKERARIEQELATATARNLPADVAAANAELEANKRAINAIRDKMDAKKKAADQDKKEGQSGDQAVAAHNYLTNGYHTDSYKHKLDTDNENKEFALATQNLAKNSKQYEDLYKHHKENLAAIDEAYRKKSGVTRQENVDWRASLQSLQNQIKTEVDTYQDGMTKLKAQYDNGEIDYKKYIDDKAKLKTDELNAEITTTQLLLDNAKKHGASAKVEQEKYKGELEDYNAQLKKVGDQRVADMAAHALQISQIEKSMSNSFDKIARDRQTAFNKEIAKTTMTPNEAAAFDAQNSIRDQFANEKDKRGLELNKAGLLTGSDEYNAEIKKIDDAMNAELVRDQARQAERLQNQKDWQTASITTLRTYAEQAQNTASLASTAIGSIFSSMESSLADSLANAQFSLKGMLKSILLDFDKAMAQMAAKQVMGVVAQGITTLFGGGFASGGDVDAGKSYWVGENGPERFVPSSSGTIIPNTDHTTSSSKTSNSVNINLGGIVIQGTSDVSQTDLAQLSNKLRSVVISTIQNEQRSGGLLSK